MILTDLSSLHISKSSLSFPTIFFKSKDVSLQVFTHIQIIDQFSSKQRGKQDSQNDKFSLIGLRNVSKIHDGMMMKNYVNKRKLCLLTGIRKKLL